MQFNFIPQPELVVVPKPNPVSAEGAGVGLLEVGKSMQESVLRERLFASSLAPATPSAGTAAVKAARGWGDSSKSELEETLGTGGASSVGCAFTGRFSTMDAKLLGGMREVDFRLNSGFSSPLPPPRVFVTVKRTATVAPAAAAAANTNSASPACLGTIAFELNGEGIFPLANVKNKSAFGLLEIHKAPCIVTAENMKTANTTHTMRPKAFQPASLFMTTCRDWMSIFTSYSVSSDLHKNDGHVLKDGHYGRHFTVECTYKALDGSYNAPNAWFQDYHCQVLPQVCSSSSSGGTCPHNSASSSRLLHVNNSASERTQMRALADSLETMNKDTRHKRAHILGTAQTAISVHGLSSEGEIKIKERAAGELAALTEETIKMKDERYEAASKYRSTITYVPIFMAGFTKGDIGVWCPLRGAMLCRLNNSSTRAPPKTRVLNGGAVTAITCLKGSMQRAVERCTEAMLNDFNGLYIGSGSGYASKYADSHVPGGLGSVTDPAASVMSTGSNRAGLSSPTSGTTPNTGNGAAAADGGIYAACYTSADVLIFGIDSVTEGCVLRIVGGGVFGNRPLQSLSTGVFPWELNCALHPPFTIWKDQPDSSDILDEAATSPPHVLLSSLKRKKKGHASGTPILGFNNADDEEDWPASSYLHKPPEIHNSTSSAVVGSGHFTGLLWSQREVFTALITSSEAVSHVFEGSPMAQSDDDPSDWSPSNQGISPRRTSPSRDDSADTFENLSPPPRSESPCVGSGATAVLKRAKRNHAGNAADSTTNSSTFKNGGAGGGRGGGGGASSQPRPEHIRTAPSYRHSLAILAPTLSAHMFLLRSMHYNNLGFLTTANGIVYVLSLPTLTPIGAIRMQKFDLHGETLSLCGLANHCPGTAAYQRSKLAVDAHVADGACAIDPILCGAPILSPTASNKSAHQNNNNIVISAPVQTMLLSITGERDSIDLVKVDIEIPPASWMGASEHDSLPIESPPKKSSSSKSNKSKSTATHSNNNCGVAAYHHLQEGTICSAMMNECIIPDSIKKGQMMSLAVGASSPCFGGSHSRSTSEIIPSLETSNTNVGGGGGGVMNVDSRQLPFYVQEALRTEASNPLFAWIHSPKLGSAAALFACSEGEFQPVRTTLVKSLAGHSSWVLSTAGLAAPQLHNFAQATHLPISGGPEVLAQHIADITQAANAAASHHNNMNARNSFAFNKTVSTGLFKVVNQQQVNASTSSLQIANRSLSALPTQHPNITFGTALAGMPHYTAVQKCLGETSPMTGIIITSVSMDQHVKVWMVEGCVSISVRGQPGGGVGLDGTTNRSFGASPSSGTFISPTTHTAPNSNVSNNQVSLSVMHFHVQDDPLHDLATLDTVLTNEDGRTDHAAKVVATGVDGRCAFLMLAHKGKASLFDVEGYNLGDTSGL